MSIQAKKSTYEELTDKKALYEKNRYTAPLISYYLVWRALSLSEQQRAQNEWEEYYTAARQIPSANNYYLQRDALKGHDIQEVRRRVEEARQIRLAGLTLKKPTLPDFDKCVHNETILAYANLLVQIALEKDKDIVADF